MQDSEDLYELLQVHPRAEPEVLQAAYRCLVFKYHPDRNSSPRATLQMQELNHAYEVLSDPTRRAKYNSIRNSSNATVIERNDESAYDVTDDMEESAEVPDATPGENSGKQPSTPAQDEGSGQMHFTIAYPDRPRFGFRLPSWVIILIALGAIGGLITDLII